MNFTQSFKLAIKSLMLSKMRALLTMLGIIIGVAAVIIITSLGNGMQNAPGGQIWDFDIAAFRGAPRTAFCVSTEYIDGGIDIFEADSSVKTAPSPVIFDDLRCGC